MEQTYTFHIAGMHCQSCVLLTESELQEITGVKQARSSLAERTVTVTGDFGDMSKEQLLAAFNKKLQTHGYTVSLERTNHQANWAEFRVALPLALLLVVLFFGLQKMGIVNFVDARQISYGTIFLIGIIASLSTCMAVVGGLVLSLSATFAKEGEAVRPQLWFHLGRIAAFFLFGGVIGMIGANVTLSSTATFVLGLLVGLVMLLLGINLLDVFPWAKQLQPAMPKVFSRHALGVARFNHKVTPLLVGIATFFLPCGFTQSMQLYALTTGSFLSGGLTMLTFALGTLPVLALVSFSSLGIHDSAKKGVFFKTAGLVVILFALFNMVNSLVVIGLIPPIFNF